MEINIINLYKRQEPENKCLEVIDLSFSLFKNPREFWISLTLLNIELRIKFGRKGDDS